MFALLLVASQSFYGMHPVPPNFTVAPASTVQISNMPKVRSQGILGLCYAYAAAAVFDALNCQEKKIAECASLPEHERASPLDMARYAAKVEDDLVKDLETYEGMKEGGWGTFALRNAALNVESVARGSCVPISRSRLGKVRLPLDDMTDEQASTEKGLWPKLEREHADFIKKCKTCTDAEKLAAVTAIKVKYDIEAPVEELLVAFNQKKWRSVFDRILIPRKCLDEYNKEVRIGLAGKWKEGVFPLDKEKTNYLETFKVIEAVLKDGSPVLVGFCTQEKLVAKSEMECGEASSPKSTGMHALVITGLRQMCDAKGKCVNSLKLHNSWGISWQKSHDDGWVDAKTLLDRTFYEPYMMSWFQKRRETASSPIDATLAEIRAKR